MERPHDEEPMPMPEPVDRPSPAGASDAEGPFTGKALLAGVIAAAAAVVLVLTLFTGQNAEPVSDAEEFAALAFLTAEGDTATLADYKGDPLVVNFFASWCAPCRAELPDFEAVHVANGEAVRFVGINHDLDEATWRNFVAETNISFETVFQPNAEIWGAMEAKGTPATAFISPEGELLYLWTGVLNDEKLQELIDLHLLEKA